MYNGFNDIIVGLKNLGNKLESDELHRKFLTSLPLECRPKVTPIEAKKLKTVTMEKLLGLLITCEHNLERDKKEMEINKDKKKDLAL